MLSECCKVFDCERIYYEEVSVCVQQSPNLMEGRYKSTSYMERLAVSG